MLGSFKMQRETSEPVMPSRPVSALFFSSLKGKVLIRKKKSHLYGNKKCDRKISEK